MSEFDRFVDEVLDFFWQSSPCGATFAGIHQYDHELDHMDRDYLENVNKQSKAYIQRLNQWNKSKLSADEYLDWQLLINALESGVKTYEDIRPWQKDPSSYATLCLYGLFILVIRDFASIEERTRSFLARLKQVPRLLGEARVNLKDSPEVFTRLALEVVEGGQSFFQDVVGQLGARVPALADELKQASLVATAAFAEYGAFLKNDYLARSKGDFAIGEKLFNFKLGVDHMLPYKADEVLAIGREAKTATEKELAETSRMIDKSKPWVKVVEDVKLHHPEAKDLLATYRREMERARDFVRAKDLVTIPPGEELAVIDTPPFDRPTIPYAAYMPPAPFETRQKGYFYVTPVEAHLDREQQQETLKGHPIHGIPVIALHEAYPGHHLQLVHSNRVPRKLRRMLGTSVFAEGWALYCEEMMHDAGFYSDSRTKLLKLKDQLWRACRVIIDVGLHTKTMSFDEAVDFLVNEAKLQRVHAIKEVTRYTISPTQPLSYLIGKKQILELKKDYQEKKGKDFNLKEFHDQLLSFGTIPVVLIREALGLAKCKC